jgi:hypothetical protein
MITQVIRFDRTGLELSLARFLDDVAEDSARESTATVRVPYPLLVASGLAAFEVSRRWHQNRESQRKNQWKVLNQGLSGLA